MSVIGTCPGSLEAPYNTKSSGQGPYNLRYPGTRATVMKADRQPWDSASGGLKMIIFDTQEDAGVRMSTTTITRDGLKAELQAETGFTTQEQKCAVNLATFGSDAYYLEQCGD